MNEALYRSQHLKQQYMEIEIPEALDHAILTGLTHARQNTNQKRNKKRSLQVAAVLLIAMASLTATVNVSSTFANRLAEIPMLHQIVKILRFVDDKAQGGTITDGTDIHQMEVLESGEVQRFIIHFDQSSDLGEDIGAFMIQKYAHPNSVQFDIGGARLISASEDFETIRGLSYVKDVYTLMTLDDSLIRFQVVLEEGVYLELSQTTDPAGLLVTLTPKQAPDTEPSTIYSLRSTSFPLTENFGHLEEMLMGLEHQGLLQNYRILKDPSGQFAFEIGQFKSETDAQETLDALKGVVPFDLVIEAYLGAD